MRRLDARLALLWGAFAAAHLLVAWLGWVLPHQPMGDVVLVYRPWSQDALTGGAIVGITASWVYPQLALVPMLIGQVLAIPFLTALGPDGAYLVGWAILVTLVDLWGMAVLLGRGGAQRLAAGWFWCAAIVALGPIAMYRIDAITVPLAVAGCVWLITRPALAAAVLTIAAWMKIWPAALVLAAAAARRRAGRMLGTAVIVSTGIIVLLVMCGAGGNVFGFLGMQAGRGLQIEAVAATPFLWAALAGAARIEYSSEILTFQIAAQGVDTVATLLMPVMLVVVVGILILGVRAARRGAHWQRTIPPLALALVAALIVTNKVGSPQFQTWLIAPVVLWLIMDRPRARPAVVLVLALCALTFTLYPVIYNLLLAAHPAAVLVITVRNALLIVLVAFAVRTLARTPVASPRPH